MTNKAVKGSLTFALICIGGISFLLCATILEGKILLSDLESQLGRPLRGEGLTPSYEKFNAYYEEGGRKGRATLLWGFQALILPWAVGSAALCIALAYLARRRLWWKIAFSAIACITLVIVLTNVSTINHMTAWLE